MRARLLRFVESSEMVYGLPMVAVIWLIALSVTVFGWSLEGLPAWRQALLGVAIGAAGVAVGWWTEAKYRRARVYK